MSSNVLSKGDRVVISGLIRAVHLNGRLGTVISVPKSQKAATRTADTIHYGIQVDGEEKCLAIKVSNLSLYDAEDDDPNFDVGDHVQLHGLKTSKFNGRRGVVVQGLDPSNENRYSVRMDKGNQVLGVKAANIRFHTKTTKELEMERNEMRNATNNTREEAFEADLMALMRGFTNAFLGEEEQIRLFGRRIQTVPDFVAELKREGGGYPVGVNHRWADNHLALSYELASNLPHFDELHLKSALYEPELQDYIKRLRGYNEDKFRWYFSARQVGDIYANRKVAPYSEAVRHNYSNQTYRSEALREGTTHVAVGFVDLGLLMAAELRPQNDREEREPLRFVGVERSAFCVAKAYVIWELIREAAKLPERAASVLVDAILQVWFSSTWTADTEGSVRKVLCDLCRPNRSYHPQVRNTLEHWKHAQSMSLVDAREAHMERVCEKSPFIGNLSSKIDRIALARYELTGDFAVREGSNLCGSIIMSDCPEFTPPSAFDENVFAALDFRLIMKIANSFGPLMSIMDAAEWYARVEVIKIVSWCRAGKLDIELICSTFEASIDLIASKKPRTMSWSNILDYMGYEDFHEAARRCSRHSDTVHFGYSMNWAADVWGTCLIDYSHKEHGGIRAEILDLSNHQTMMMYHSIGWSKRIWLPLRQNPLNTTSLGLEMSVYMTWINHFFLEGQKTGKTCKIVNVLHDFPCPLSATGGSTVCFTWTYDPEVNVRN